MLRKNLFFIFGGRCENGSASRAILTKIYMEYFEKMLVTPLQNHGREYYPLWIMSDNIGIMKFAASGGNRALCPWAVNTRSHKHQAGKKYLIKQLKLCDIIVNCLEQ